MRLSLIYATALAAFAVAAPSITRRSDLVVHEKRAQEPRDWILTRRLEPTAVLPMRFGLTQSNLHKVEEMLMSVSHPSSPKYGQHFSAKEIVLWRMHEGCMTKSQGLNNGEEALSLRIIIREGWSR